MRINKNLIILLLTGFLVSSCLEDELELDPQQSLSTSTAFASVGNATGTVFGVYHLAQDLDVFGSMPQLAGDYMADNVNFVGTFPTLQDVNSLTHLADNGSTGAWWSEAYELISSANLVIEGVPTVPDIGEAEAAALIGEAKFLRALTYFHLVNLFAQPVQIDGGQSLGLPLILEAFNGDPVSVNLPRSTVEEVHQQIRQDLLDAVAGLPDSYGTDTETRGRATSGAARALLSRLHLYREEWTEAADFANQVIQSSIYTLAPDYTFYDGLTAEDVFTIVNTVQDNGATGSGGWDNYYEPSEQNGRGDGTFSQSLISAFEEEPGDLRFVLKKSGLDAANIMSMFTTKYDDALNDDSDAPIIRVTEIYLNRAEALAMITGSGSPNIEALDLINTLRTRAGLEDLAPATNSELIDAIAVERRKELCFEGHRRMDLLRRGLPLRTTGNLPASQPTGVGISSPGDDKVIIGIPQDQVDLSEGVLVQNPGF